MMKIALIGCISLMGKAMIETLFGTKSIEVVSIDSNSYPLIGVAVDSNIIDQEFEDNAKEISRYIYEQTDYPIYDYRCINMVDYDSLYVYDKDVYPIPVSSKKPSAIHHACNAKLMRIIEYDEDSR